MILIPQKQKLLNLNLNLIMPSVLTTSFKINKPERNMCIEMLGGKCKLWGKLLSLNLSANKLQGKKSRDTLYRNLRNMTMN